MIKNKFYKEIAALDEGDRLLLGFMAIIAGVADDDDFAAYRRVTKKTAKDTKERLKRLTDLHMVVKIDKIIFYYSDEYKVSAIYYLPALKYLLVENSDWAAKFRPLIPKENPFNVMQRAMTIALDGKAMPVSVKRLTFTRLVSSDFLVGIAFDKDLLPLSDLIVTSQFTNVFTLMMQNVIYADEIIDEKVFTALIDRRDDLTPVDEIICKEALAYNMYLSQGVYTAPQGKGKGLSIYSYLLQGVRYAHQQDYAKAMRYIDGALKMRNKLSSLKNVFSNVYDNFMLIALYVRIGEEKKMTQYLNKKMIDTQYYPAMLLAESKVCPDNMSTRYLSLMYTDAGNRNNVIYKAFALPMSKLWDYEPLCNVGNDYLPNTAILRFELQNLLPLSDDERQRLNALYGTPIFQAVKPLPRWQRILEEIAKNGASPAEEEKANVERIIYILGPWRMEVRIQKMLKSGAWGVGKEISQYQYTRLTAELSCMDNVDKSIYEMNGRTFYGLRNEDALPKLVGSNRVFFQRHYGGELEPVTVDEEKAYLIVDKGKKYFSFSSNLDKVTAGKTQYVVKKSDTHYSIIKITKQEASLYEELLNVGNIPLEGEKVLMDTLPAISRNVEIRSSIFKGKNALKTIDGSTKIIIQAKQDKTDEYLVDMLAKPLPEGKEHFIPGKGKPTILDTQDGTPVQVKRKLKKETENAEAVLVFIDDDMTTEIDDYADRQPDDCFRRTISTRGLLMLLEYVRQLADVYEVEWLEGKKVKAIATPTQWNVGLRQSGQWFEVEGNVQVDEKRVLSIAQLLQLMDFDGNRNYVKLGDNEYMMLTDALRRQLSKLEAIAMKDKDSLRIPVNNASLLADAMTGDINIANQEKLQEVVGKIKASYDLKPKVPSNLNATLRDYQQEGFRWMARLDSWGAGACLADDMGLGKTVQTIAMLLYNAKKGASLVVAPTSVVSNWRNELSRFAPSLTVSLINEYDSDTRKEIIKKSSAREVLLTTYGILSIEEEAFTAKEWNVVCLDEAHTIKNRDTKMAHAAHSLNAKTRIALTGTPLQNHLGELWSLFNFINPGLLGNYDMFRQKFVVPIESGNKTRQQQLRKIILPFMLRRTKNEVIEELPDKTEIVRTVELSADEMHAYETFRRSAKKKLEEEQKVSVSVLAEITKLRQAACAACLADKKLNYKSSKIEQLLQLVDNIGEDGNRILLFSQFTSFLKMVKEAFDKEKIEYLYLDGSTTMKQRAELVRRFQDGESRIFIISLKAGGLGLNLTGANYVIHMDPWWNPAIEQQATDRAYRIGQEQKVTVYHLISEHTIEEKILRLHQSKRDLADSLLEGADVSHKITEEDLNELLM